MDQTPLTPGQVALIEGHTDLARCLAGERANAQGGQFSDLLSDCFIGLIDAARRFDPTVGAQFKTYATYRMIGAMRDGWRERDFLTRFDRKQLQVLTDLRNAFICREGRIPNDAELANEIGWTSRRLGRFVQRTAGASLSQITETLENGDDEDRLRYVEEFVRDDEPTAHEAVDSDHSDLHAHLACLSRQERFVIGMYFWEGCTLREIGGMLEVHETRACQIKQNALAKLRNRMPQAA